MKKLQMIYSFKCIQIKERYKLSQKNVFMTLVYLKRAETWEDARLTFRLRTLYFERNDSKIIGYSSNKLYTVMLQGLSTDFCMRTLNTLGISFKHFKAA